jgi:hypothetical protein
LTKQREDSHHYVRRFRQAHISVCIEGDGDSLVEASGSMQLWPAFEQNVLD